MKTAIYIEDGVVQLVLTPEGEFEKNSLKSFEGREVEAKVFTGSFYDCRGGWVRQAHYSSEYPGSRDDKSLILRVNSKQR